jgi:putative MATE family efflux protein
MRVRLPQRVRFGRHRDDRAIVALALPALGALAADPLYSVIDTAFVGHLGTPELGAVAVGTTVFNASFWIFSFLAYGLTPRVARAFGAGDMARASRLGVQALLLAVTLGALVTAAGLMAAPAVIRMFGAEGRVAALAEGYLSIRVLAAAPVLVAQVGHGWLRGAQDTRTAMVITVAGTAANTALDYLLIFLLGWGLGGAAWSNVVGQLGAAVAFVAVLRSRWGAVSWRADAASIRSLLGVGADLIVRTGALLAAVTVASSVAARMGVVALASWQIAMQRFLLLALTLDSVAIAAQALVGRFLGAGDLERAGSVARRLMTWGWWVGASLLVPVLVLRGPLAGVFSDDPEVVSASARLLAWIALVQPLSGAAFTLDGILLGASDTRWLAGAMLSCSALYIGLALVALEAGWGLGGLVAGATVWLVARTASTGARFAGGAWKLRP